MAMSNARPTDPPVIRQVLVDLPRDQRSVSVRFGLTAATWQTVVACNQFGGQSGSDAIFGIPHDLKADRTALAVSFQDGLNSGDMRLVAVDAQGREQLSSGRGMTIWQKPCPMLDAEFDLPSKQIREYRLQTRGYELSADFLDIPLPTRVEPAK